MLPWTLPRPLAALRAAFLEDAPDTLALELVDVVPDIDAGDVQEALNTFASPAVALRSCSASTPRASRSSPADYTAALSLVPTDGELVPTLDGPTLAQVVSSRVTAAARSTPPWPWSTARRR